MSQSDLLILIAKYLEQKEAELLEILVNLFQMPLREDITSADTVIFMDEDCESIASVWIYYDGKNKKIDKNDKSLFPGRSLEIINLSNPQNDLILRQISDISESEEKFEYLDALANLVKNWFADVWKKADGENYPLPVALAVHDDFGDGKVVKLS
jgi:archaellum biogenesis protein FlaJ (TadC family)